MAKFIRTATLTILPALPAALGGALHAINSCREAIYCAGARNDGSATGVTTIAAGATYTSTLAANNDNIGAVLKCATQADASGTVNPYQLELTVQSGVSYMDLPHENGDPFLDSPRWAEIPGTACRLACAACRLACAASDTSCEWPTLTTCISQGDAYLHLCSST
ncbi:hypothetical protein F5Y15DRAFT_421246 [Xylariaceae sp. FL0016]|nr:hypothetical protein F5Y15DRAFT_421246 [Xylariaceae sp. FL0016]